jgi:protein phosphatase
MSLEFFSVVDTGRARSNNEDCVGIDEALGLAVLADGMGGYNAGEVASDMAVSRLRSELAAALGAAQPLSDSALPAALRAGAQAANRAVYEAALANADYAGMGTTLVAALFGPRSVWVGHIGDSRAYRLRDGHFEQITRDHSLLQEQMDAGLLTADQAAFSVHRNLVTRAVGVEPEVEVELHEHDLREGDTLLMCSDGLSDMLPDRVIAELLSENNSLEAAAHALVAAANAAGGRDNIAVILVRAHLQPLPASRSWWPFRR